MGDFRRGVSVKYLASLRRLTEHPGDNWWKDLLRLWTPSGIKPGEHGLRLAIRSNSLNFYSRGQSVARVAFNREGEPCADVHLKYVFGPAERTQGYARLLRTQIWRGGKVEREYEGASTLIGWIANADSYVGAEKRFVDDLISDNPSIIDLEMGLPATDNQKTAPRMDCVALEEGKESIDIVFWEAKRIDDSRLRSRTTPEVIKQIGFYRSYLGVPQRARYVVDAYRTACSLLVEMSDMAAFLGKRPEIHPLIRRAAAKDANLRIDQEPRLVIFGGAAGSEKGNWDFHEAKLRNVIGSPLLVFYQNQGPYPLSCPEPRR
jgi:hypothetical protein